VKSEPSKKKIRQEFLHKRESLDTIIFKKNSAQICIKIQEWLNHSELGLSVRWIGCFAPYRGEADITSLYSPSRSQNSKGTSPYKTALPVISDVGYGSKDMDFYEFREGDPFKLNKYGIKEPLKDQASLLIPVKQERTLILVPALAVDREGHRLGYGGGFYDRFLAKYPGVLAFGVIFEEFLLDQLPAESHDQRLSGFVTENGLTFLKKTT
jgi:5-formyltetrahydrofolate cyclo-ligase